MQGGPVRALRVRLRDDLHPRRYVSSTLRNRGSRRIHATLSHQAKRYRIDRVGLGVYPHGEYTNPVVTHRQDVSWLDVYVLW